MAKDLWSAVAFISIATACHQAWSANMFTVASDAFPSRAVGSVVGFGGMCGDIGGMLMLLVAGGMLQWLGNFTPLFIFAGVMHPLAWIAIRALVGKNFAQIDLDKGLRTAQSPALLAMGLGLLTVGATLAALVFAKMEGSLRSFPSVLELLSLVNCAVYARNDQIACLGVLRSSGALCPPPASMKAPGSPKEHRRWPERPTLRQKPGTTGGG